MKTKSTIIIVCCMLTVITSYAQTNSSSWLLKGNSGTDSSKNFIGTTDAEPLVFKVNNQKAGYLDYDSLTGNTGFGYQSLFTKSRQEQFNTAIGYQTLYFNRRGSANTAVGYQALFSNRFGYYNTANGFQALFSGFKGLGNTANGYQALFNNRSGDGNTAIGFQALFNNYTGQYNTATGWYALGSHLNGYGNTASGAYALSSNTTGLDNTASGAFALSSNTTGSTNTASGLFALSNNTTGRKNTGLGHNSNVTEGDLTNATAIGWRAFVDASNKVRIGNMSVTSIGGQVGWSQFSDQRVKKDVQENVPGLAFIKALRPVTYHFSVDKEEELMGVKDLTSKTINAIANSHINGIAKPDGVNMSSFGIQDEASQDGKYDIEKTQFTGLIAQDVDAAAKKLNYDFSGLDKTGKIWGLRYSDFVVPLVKAVQELSQENDGLKKENEDLKARLDKLEAVVFKTTSSVVELGLAAKLEQNVPNPFSNSTTIPYYLPANKGNTYINFYASNGVLLKSVRITATGKGTLNVKASELPSGTYQYALVVNGKLADSKQMIQAK